MRNQEEDWKMSTKILTKFICIINKFIAEPNSKRKWNVINFIAHFIKERALNRWTLKNYSSEEFGPISFNLSWSQKSDDFIEKVPLKNTYKVEKKYERQKNKNFGLFLEIKFSFLILIWRIFLEVWRTRTSSVLSVFKMKRQKTISLQMSGIWAFLALRDSF